MNIRALFITVIGFIIALLSGICLATENYEFFVWLPVVGLIMVSLTLQDKFWLIIPATTFVGGQLSFIPGQLNMHQLSIVLAFVFFWVLLMFRRIRWRIRFGLPEFLVCLFLAVIIQSYVRNPTGLNVLGSSNVGGKAYVHIIIGLLAYVVLAWIQVPSSHLKSARKYAISLGWLECFTLLGARVTGGYFGAGNYIYSSAASNYAQDDKSNINPESASREGFAAQGASVGGRQVASHGNPFNAFSLKLLHSRKLIWGLILTIITVLLATVSGFRSVVFSTMMLLVLSVLYYGGFRPFLKCIFLAIFFYISLLGLNAVISLPANVQRTLSFLPGNWEQQYVLDAKNSSEWRFEIWREVLTSDRWIENKILGDGPGLNSAQLSNNSKGTLAGFDRGRSTILLNGDYHSGPVTFIRCVGYVGLFIYLFISICMAYRAHKLVLKVKHSQNGPAFLFWLLPIIIAPIFFIFIFGDFKTDAPVLLINLGFLALLERNHRNESQLQINE